VAFAGVGKYNEFDQLRIAGVRHADLKGYSFSREDVDARNLANQYAQMLGQIFTHEMKPMEVEILVAEISHNEDDIQPQMFHILYDGTVKDETKYAVLGGETEVILERFSPLYKNKMTLSKAVQLAVNALSGDERELKPNDLEVAELSIANGRRAFRRINGDELAGLLS
jgi:proteasome alpha subunit